MLINTENKRIELVYPTDMSGEKTRLITVDGDADDFERDKGIFRADTALYTAALAMSAEHETILKENLTELHYDRLSFISYDNHDQNRVGMALGIKERGDTATVIIVLRGTVGREWYSNFDVGYGTEHSGFLKAAEYAEQRLSDYLFIRLPQQQELRFLVTGYSRGGAVANILSKRLCDRYGLDAVRCYTFASPNTGITVKGARYGSIFNIVRDEDFFTRVPLAGWGYTKYGRNISLSDCGDIAKRYRVLCGEDYIGITSSEAVDSVLCSVMRLAPNVHAYYERRYPVGDRMLSLCDYMTAVAGMLADDADEAVGDVLMSAMVSEFAELSDFLSSGIDIAAFLSPAQGIPRCSVADTHSATAYMAALDMYLE
ncbi:MAG: hypothetical protein IJS27_00085 [Ruminococcus sp.]|nr:hypothetical protein [Ruminococcus sp.]